MLKNNAACKKCKHAAVCYGLGLEIVLQSYIGSFECNRLGATIIRATNSTPTVKGLQEYLPSDCPLYVPGEWMFRYFGHNRYTVERL